MTMARRAAIEKETQGRRALEQHLSEETTHANDDLHREIGERLTAGILGVFDLLANLGHRDCSQLDVSIVSEAIRQVISMELQNLRVELHDLRGMLEEVRAGINRIDRFTMQRLYRFDEGEADVGPEGTVPRVSATRAPAGGRASREVVTDRVFSTAQRLTDDGQDITEMTSTALAHAAGVKPTQFTYAFKTRANFEAQFARWREMAQTNADAEADA